MKIIHLRIRNYRGLRDIEMPMSNFGCLIGENNAGKSSVLQALSLFFSGTRLTAHNYFDPTQDIRIELTFGDIGDDDLTRLENDEHRRRISQQIENGTLTIVRHYDTDGKSAWRIVKRVPKDPRFAMARIAELLKSRKAGPAFAAAVVELFPELAGVVTNADDQTAVRAHIEELAAKLPDEEKEMGDMDLPTGFDKTIAPLMPEPIYIPAVKDLADDIKTSESASFGKLLGILFKAIEPKLGEVEELFAKLHAQLNRVLTPEGEIRDERLREVQIIETTIQRFIQEGFPNVSIRINIPPPRLQSVLSGAQIVANDGMESPIESKGDGLKRSVTFSILRAYMELSRSGFFEENGSAQQDLGRYLLLFEEPELYLYPKAQQQLFDALGTFAKRHFVFVTTHSPLFFGPQATATFVKLAKKTDPLVAPKPFTLAHPIDLTDVEAKDQFQLICHENNNIAFFSETVVLVEGDSDYVLFPHIASTLNPAWDCAKVPVALARIRGKSSVRRYTRFFSRFNMRVAVIADLDIILKDFDQIDAPPETCQLRDRLIRKIDEHIAFAGPTPEPGGQRIANAHGSASLRSLWRNVREARSLVSGPDANEEWDALEQAVDEFFAWEKQDARMEALRFSQNPDILALKRNLLGELRKQDVFVLELGDIESYYPKEVIGRDKPSKAQHFCRLITSRESILALCNEFDVDGETHPQYEFDVIFGAIFGPYVQA